MAIFSSMNYFGVSSDFALSDVEDFPLQDYRENYDAIAELETWYTGAALDTTVKNKSSEDQFPVRPNPIRNASTKHSAALFGEHSDSGDVPPVRVRVKPMFEDRSDETEEIEKKLQFVLSENNFGATMIEAGHKSQYQGGAIFRVGYDPDNPLLESKITLSSIDAKDFIGYADKGNPWILREAWFVKQITASEAKAYGVEVPDNYAWYIEHWTKTDFYVRINDTPIVITANGEEQLSEGPNPFGIVPFVYIPHAPRKASGLYGESITTDGVKTLIRELSARISDSGDAVSEEVHNYAVMSNVRGAPRIVDSIPGLRIIDTGSTQALVNGDAKPELDMLKRTSLSSSMLDLVDELYKLLRRELYHPAVADGEDEGSQRSSATLYTRMWHLTSHIKMERTYWTSGIRTLAKFILMIMGMYKLLGIPVDAHKFRIGVQWSSTLPRDRTELINELAVRASNNLGSLQTLLEAVGDVDDVEAEVEEIIEWLKEIAELNAIGYGNQQQGGAPGQGKPFSPKTNTQTRPPSKKAGGSNE